MAGSARNQLDFIQPGSSSPGIPPAVEVGTAAAAVAHVTITFTDGSTRTVRPVDAGGPRFYAFAVPVGALVRQLTYYSAAGSVLGLQRAR